MEEISRAIDFFQLKLNLSLQAGPDGVLNIDIEEMFSQAPLLLNLILRAQKSIGQDLLVPGIFSFKPQVRSFLSFFKYYYYYFYHYY